MAETRNLEPPVPGRNLITPKDLAKRLAVSERTAREKIRTGEISSYRIGGARRIDPQDVDRYLAERRSEGTDRR